MALNIERVKQKLTEFNSKDEIRERLVKQYMTYGYYVKPGDIFYKITLDGEQIWGLKVGQLTHSCHIDTTEFVVLFFVDKTPNTKLVSDNWLINSLIV